MYKEFLWELGGYKVIQNDIASYLLNDYIIYVSSIRPIEAYVDELLNYESDYNEAKILAIAIIDSSVNEVDFSLLDNDNTWNGSEDKIKKFFISLSKTPLNSFIDKALNTIEECINDPFYPAEGESLEILKTYKKRLMTHKNLVSIKKVTHI